MTLAIELREMKRLYFDGRKSPMKRSVLWEWRGCSGRFTVVQVHGLVLA